MSVLRQHTVLLDQTGVAPTIGSSYAIVPSDADAVADAYGRDDPKPRIQSHGGGLPARAVGRQRA